MPLNSFADVQKFFNDFINMHKIIVGQPHGEFWNTLSYTDFVTGTVPGIKDSNGNTIPILTKGDGKNSNIVQALAGTGMFDPNMGSFPQMPYEGPYFSTAQIQELSDWITNGCPE